MVVGEEAPLALCPVADKVGGFLRAPAVLMDNDPVGRGEQLEAVGSLEPVDQLRDALVTLARLRVVRLESLRLHHGTGQHTHARIAGAVAEAAEVVSLQALDSVP